MHRFRHYILTAIATVTLFSSDAQTFTSVTDGAWEDGGTWGNTSPGANGVDYPNNNDTVIISGGTTVTQSSTERPWHLTISSNGELISNANIIVKADYHNDGLHSGTGQVRLQGNGLEISGVGEISTTALMRVNAKRRILAGSDLTRTGANIRCPNGDTLVNEGTLTLSGENLVAGATGVFRNTTGGVLVANRAVMSNGTLIASDSGNTVIFNRTGGGNQNIPSTFDGFYNLIIQGNNQNSEKRLQADETVLNDFEIQGSTFIPLDTYKLRIGGDMLVDNAANFDVRTNQAKVIFNGAGPQNVSGKIDIEDVEIDHSGPSVSLMTDSMFVYGTLDVTQGTLNSGGHLVIASDINGDGRVGEVFGSISGDATVQRYIAKGLTGWRFLCAPISNAILADWNDDFITAGFPGSDAPGFNFTSIMSYDESVAGHQDSGFVDPSGMGQAIAPTQAYWVYCGDGNDSTTAFTIDVTGPLNTGPIVYPVTYTNTTGIDEDGWNLVSNPYASPIDWDAPGWVKTNIDSAVYIWNTSTASYASYVNGIGNNGGSRAIASSQGFYVKANANSPGLTINESCKKDTLAKFLRPTSYPILRLNVKSNELRYETSVRLTRSATLSFDRRWDAYYLAAQGSSIGLWSTSDGKDLSINSLPLHGSDTIPIRFFIEGEAKATFGYTRNNQMEGYCIGLRDNYEEVIHELGSSEGDLVLNTLGADVDRYDLIISHANSGMGLCEVTGVEEGTTNSQLQAYITGSALQLSSFSMNEVYTIYNMLGQRLLSGSVTNSAISLNTSLNPGVYIIQLSKTGSTKLFIP